MKRITVLLASFALVGSALMATGGAAQAAQDHSAPLAGALAFECTITLTWPTPNGGADDCTNGTVPAVAAGAGTHGAAPFTIGTSFNGHVDRYSEGCLAGEPPLTGDADGTATAATSAGPLEVDFHWVRVGLVAVITTGDARLNGDAHSGAGAGVAAFVPLPPIPQCGQVGSQLTAVVAGAAVAAGTDS